MTDAAATPSPTSRKRLLLVLGVIALVVIALVVGSYFYGSSAASSKASDYDDDFASWQDKDLPVLLAATESIPRGTYVTKGDIYAAKSLKRQKEGCDTVAASRKGLTAAADRFPTVGGAGLLGTISSEYSDAGDLSARREKVVKAYVKDASAALAQIERDCRFNVKLNTASSKSSKVIAKSSTYLMKRGDVEPNATCTEYDTCVSSIAKKKNAYADLRIKGTKMYQGTQLKLYTDGECAKTSYGSACEVIGKAYTTANDQALANYEFVRETASSVNNERISSGLKKLDKINARNAPRIKKAVLALDPELKKVKTVRSAPGWTDNFFRTSAKLLLEDLKEQRAALEKL